MVTTAKDIKNRAEQVPSLRFVKELVVHIKDDDVSGMAAETAYYWIFSIPPLVLLIVMSGAFLDRVANVNVVNRLRSQVNERAPDDVASVLNRLIDNGVAEVGGGVASVGVLTAALLALWSGANGMGALMKAFNRAYNIEEGRPLVRKRAVAAGLTMMLVGLLNVSFVLLVYGRRLGKWIAERAGVSDAFERGWDFSRWPVALAAIFAVLLLLYYVGPNVKQPPRYVLPGSVVATIGWLAAAAVFGIYLRYANPGSAYGVLGGVIVLLFFLYLTAMILLVGAEVNATLQQRRTDEHLEPKADPEKNSLDELEQAVSENNGG